MRLTGRRHGVGRLGVKSPGPKPGLLAVVLRGGDPLSPDQPSEQLRQPRDVDGDPTRLVLCEHLGLPRFAAAEDRSWTGVSVAARPRTRVWSTGLLGRSNRRIVAAR
jgi:hypothetical protein